ncbi:unknown protein [Oryza sativa Japonica Group]|uniref:Os01g0611300 protein n=1 Tax=Oryza sativa subsp. japonica TaxID=39947 RepID=Q5ZBI9_ORYSJ|nr:hypothetical protein DAI22_01g240200 [Oryza sativa Japonica Group]BAD61501.1 unknown protein [Oryza sativa Japonica Group]BAF05465.1 Os01g0611300 [Oryza sativa Japonica Group]|eukprot:NP_001043551.1 Os01g0611300 [Oryza sativa Japonica Group]
MNRKESWGRLTPPPPLPTVSILSLLVFHSFIRFIFHPSHLVSPSISVHVQLVTFNIDTNTLTDRHSNIVWIKTVLFSGNWYVERWFSHLTMQTCSTH